MRGRPAVEAFKGMPGSAKCGEELQLNYAAKLIYGLYSSLMVVLFLLQVPNGAAGFYLLGRIYQLSNRHSAAIAYYSTAVQLDPMMWSAYEELCTLGG